MAVTEHDRVIVSNKTYTPMPDVANQCAADYLAELIEAEALFEFGYVRAAALVARYALNLRLIQLCEQHDCLPRRPWRGTKSKITRLHLEGVLSLEFKEAILRALYVGNLAAHEDGFSSDQVEEMLATVRAVVVKGFDPAAEGRAPA